MSARLFSGYALLALAVIAQCGTALDRASFHTAIEQQWQAPTHHPNAPRLPQRHAPGILGEMPSLPIFDRTASLPRAARPDPRSPLLAGIFVPPRV
jgi:hypothetical protein